MIIFYLWGFKPDEKETIPLECINHNTQILPLSECKIITPNDLTSLIAEHPKLVEIWDKIPKWIIKTDIARLLLIYKYGGYYLDSDCEIIKDFTEESDSDNDIVLFTEIILKTKHYLGPRELRSKERLLRIANYAFGTNTPNHPFIMELINEICRRLNKLFLEEDTQKNNPCKYSIWTDKDIVWVSGPDVITSLYHKYKKTRQYQLKLFDQTYLKHHKNGSWRTKV